MTDCAKTFYELDIKIGGWLRIIREEQGLTQQDVVQRMSGMLSVKQLDKYERGIHQITTGQLWLLSQVLGAPTSYFLGCSEGKI